MKKTISNFSRVLCALMLCAGLMVTGCYDDSALQGQIGKHDEQLKDHESRLKELETLCNRQNTNIESLQAIVTALQDKDYVTNVAPINEGDKVLGYTITFSKSGAVTIYNGKDGYVPVMGVKQEESDGQWYWTVDGEWLLDSKGDKVRASALDGEDGEPGTPGQSGVTPTLKIVDGYWYVSYDNGQNWERYAPATGEKGDKGDPGENGGQGSAMFKEVTYDSDYVYLTLSDGTVLTVPRIKIYSGENMVGPATLVLEKVTSVAAMFTGNIDLPENLRPFSQVAVYYSDKDNFNIHDASCEFTTAFDENGDFNLLLKHLDYGVTYKYCVVVTVKKDQYYGDVLEFATSNFNASLATDLSVSGTANSYIVSETGTYKLKAVKGNSSEGVGTVAYADVIWESYGTEEVIKVCDIVTDILYVEDYIVFKIADTFKEGNALIAAKDISGNILWSWHIWLTDQPEEQRYYNNAGIMMDRNLGATSATPGDVGALGLLYQWGRKDPFLGSSSISSNTLANSTITWPSAVSSDSSNGTISYATANPTTFISYNSSNNDWYYTGSSSTDNTRWTTSESNKSIYDPCPAGWRVPDGGRNGVWSKASGSPLNNFSHTYDSSNEGMNFSGKFGANQTIWYPASGWRLDDDGSLSSVGDRGYCWSASPNGDYAFRMYFSGGVAFPFYNSYRANGQSVRCVKEGTDPGASSVLSVSDARSLATNGTANSYIVSEKGTYSFPSVKGNSSISVGSVEFVEVLWESFGTDVIPEKGDLISASMSENGNIYFKTADTFKEGNAVIAAKDASGKILWSWHIWFTDQPQGQVYYNDAGTMMDRNLGATSVTPGDVGALGLLYQWGRKDPFLGSSSLSSNTLANSTITWPSAVSSDSSNGTIEYATANPTTFISYNSSNYDWYYTGSSSTDNTRWTTSESNKSIYDPCPAGWRVPDGGSNGVWSKALGSSSSFRDYPYDSTNEGMNFSGKFGADQTIWYPASGCRIGGAGSLNFVGSLGNFWSASPNYGRAYHLSFGDSGLVYPSGYDYRAYGQSVRCLQVIDEVAEL